MSCLCPSCSVEPAFTYTEAHRIQCEARTILKKPKPVRKWYLGEVHKRRGEDSAIKLLTEMMRQGGENAVSM